MSRSEHLWQIDQSDIMKWVLVSATDIITPIQCGLSGLEIVMTILDIIEFLFGLDAEYGLSDT